MNWKLDFFKSNSYKMTKPGDIIRLIVSQKHTFLSLQIDGHWWGKPIKVWGKIIPIGTSLSQFADLMTLNL